MKLNLPKFTQAIPLTDYAPEMTLDDGSPALVWVWINPPTALLDSHTALRARGKKAGAELERVKADDTEAMKAVAQALANIGQEMAALFAELWSARQDEATHWTADEVLALASNQENPALFSWLTNRTIAAVNDYRAGLRKN